MNKLAAMVLNKDMDLSKITIDEYEAYQSGNNTKRQRLLNLKSANQCLADAHQTPVPGMLFSQFWHEGELCILFADTNIGKSILAVQIADRISRGQTDHIFQVEAPAQCVLYLDFELSEKQFEKRYSDDYFNHYEFHPHLYRLDINTDYESFADFETELEAEIEETISSTGARVLIVDNITYLKTQTTESAKDAIPLMKMLIKLKKKYSLSILALAHTPKRDHCKEITVNDLAGSKHISNFADSIFAIGQSHKDNKLRYIKQIKARATEKFYDSDYVIICKIEKHINFLGFTQVAFEPEWEHLKLRTHETEQTNAIEEQVIALYREDPDVTLREIARQAGLPDSKRVKRILLKNGMIQE